MVKCFGAARQLVVRLSTVCPHLRIGFNARLLASPDVRGFNRYTAELVRALAATGRVEPVLLSDAPIHERHNLGTLPAVVEDVHPQIRWQHRWLPHALRREQIDLFHAPAHWGVPWFSRCPVVATIHDLADRELPHLAPPASMRASARHALEQSLVVHRACRIIAVSQWTARSIERFLGVPRERISVTVEGAAPAFDGAPGAERVAAARSLAGLPERYFIYVGGFEARKNLGALVAALAATPERERLPVAFVGEPAGAGQLTDLARVTGVAPWVRLVGALDDGRLAALYAGAVAVVLPSWLEGFGLPVVEAMHVGTPAVVSTGSSLTEIAGDAALTFPPDNPDELAAAMGHLASDPALRAHLAARARERAQLFTWRRAAEQTVAVYEEALTRRP